MRILFLLCCCVVLVSVSAAVKSHCDVNIPSSTSYRDRRASDGSLKRSDKFAKGILCEHNYFRESVGVPALQWSHPLASLATSFLEELTRDGRCDFYHSDNTPWQEEYLQLVGNFEYGTNYGENLFSQIKRGISSTGIPTEYGIKAVDSWFSEIQDYKYIPGTYKGCSTGMIGHFTQVMWSDTKEVGCDYAFCSNGKELIVLCEYGPSGNYVSKAPFNNRVWRKLLHWNYVKKNLVLDTEC